MKALLLLAAAAPAFAQITVEHLRSAQADTTVWINPARNASSWRYSELDEINTGNVAKLAPLWTYKTASKQVDATPLVYGGRLFYAGAIELLTGKPVWTHDKSTGGFATIGDRLFEVHRGGTLVALDRSSGRVLWEIAVAGATAAAPLIANGLVIVGGETFIDAYDPSDGKRAWRVPAGVPAAGTGSFDAEFGLLLWSTRGYVLAIDAATGKPRWMYELEGGATPGSLVLADVTTGNQRIKGVLFADSSGGYTLLDRTTGKLIHTRSHETACAAGGIAGSYSPQTNYHYVNICLSAMNPATGEIVWRTEIPTASGTLATAGGLVFAGDAGGFLNAVDARTGKIIWRFQTGASVTAPPVTVRAGGRQIVAIAAGGSILTFALTP